MSNPVRSAGTAPYGQPADACDATAVRLPLWGAAPAPWDVTPYRDGSPVLSAPRRSHTEGVAWCDLCGATGATGRTLRHTPSRAERIDGASPGEPIPGHAPGCALVRLLTGTPSPVRGARVPSALDGPRATDLPRRVVRRATDGTGTAPRPDTSPATGPTGEHRSRSTAARPDHGAVRIGRLSIHAWHAVAVRGRGATTPAPYGTPAYGATYGPRLARVAWWGIGSPVRADGAPRVANRRRSRAAIIAATAPAPAPTPAPVLADAAAMIAAGSIG